ncbi:MAG TPA: DNA polymerase domain-containing protein [Actinomycetota bacterium]|nr:DNA polymerase domain-containing protein [Actinomycetota bacterium]
MGAEILQVDGHEVRVSNPDKVYFPQAGITKMQLVQYFLDVAPGVLKGCYDRPTTLHRYPGGVEEEDFWQKRVPPKRPEWLRTAMITFPSGRSAEMLCVHDTASLAWAINLGCLELNPWAVRRGDVDHPDEFRIDLDPTPGIDFADVRRVAAVAAEVLQEHGLVGFPKTTGKRGLHVYVRIRPLWEFTEVRRAALAFAREIERRMPGVATTAWWKEERVGVFLDYNQNARDRTISSAYSVRPVPDARVSCPVSWDEVADVEPSDLRVDTVPARFATVGDPGAALDDNVCVLDSLLDLAARDERDGLGDAPWPPHFPKAKGEPVRAMPSKRRKTD